MPLGMWYHTQYAAMHGASGDVHALVVNIFF
jgi:hypothetical protein